METSLRQEITVKVTSVIAATISVASQELGLRDSLVEKYGIESLDILDISFRINKAFGVKLYRGDFFQKASNALGDVELIHDGKLTEAGVELLRQRLPEAQDNPILKVGAPRNILIRLYCAESWIRQILELHQAGQTSGEAYLEAWLAAYRERLKAA